MIAATSAAASAAAPAAAVAAPAIAGATAAGAGATGLGGLLATPIIGGLTAGGLGADAIGGATSLLGGLLTPKPSLPNLSGLGNTEAGAFAAPPSFAPSGPPGVGGGVAPNFSALSSPALGGSNDPGAVQKAIQQAIGQFGGGGGQGEQSDPYGTGFNS